MYLRPKRHIGTQHLTTSLEHSNIKCFKVKTHTFFSNSRTLDCKVSMLSVVRPAPNPDEETRTWFNASYITVDKFQLSMIEKIYYDRMIWNAWYKWYNIIPCHRRDQNRTIWQFFFSYCEFPFEFNFMFCD